MSVVTFILNGKMCSGKNQVRTAFVHGRVMKFPNATFKTWRNVMSKQIWQQRKGMHILFNDPVMLFVHYWPGDRIRRDATGILDAIFHLLESTNIVKDDSLVKSITWVERPIDKSTPRVELSITPLEAINGN